MAKINVRFNSLNILRFFSPSILFKSPRPGTMTGVGFRVEGGGAGGEKGTQVGGPSERGGWESQVLVEIGSRLPKRPHAKIMHGAIGVPRANPNPHADSFSMPVGQSLQ